MSHLSSSLQDVSRRNAGIDFLRGVAILLVILDHISIRLPLSETSLASIFPSGILRFLTHQGHHSVFIFFVISGFLITSGIIRRWGSLRSIHLPFFYTHRFARIAPCLLVLLCVLSALDALNVQGFELDKTHHSLRGALCAALGMYVNWYECLTGYLPANWDVLWSLSIEEMFYFVFPVLCLRVPRSDTQQVMLFGCVAVSLPLLMLMMSGAPPIWRHKAYLPGAAALSTGVAAALLARYDRITPFWISALGWSGAVVLPLTCVLSFFMVSHVADTLLVGLTLSVAALLLAFSKGWGSVFQHSMFAWIRSCGLMSYEIYLTHMFVVIFLVQAYQAIGFSTQASWLCFPIVLGGAWLLGYGMDRLLSYPAERRMREIFLRFFPSLEMSFRE